VVTLKHLVLAVLFPWRREAVQMVVLVVLISLLEMLIMVPVEALSCLLVTETPAEVEALQYPQVQIQ
jgi:hypothetical protein